MKKIAWVTTWSRKCGIADYSKGLFEPTRLALLPYGIELELVSLDIHDSPAKLLNKLLRGYDSIHFQHEYGIYGGKNPPLYFFPKVIQALKKANPELRLTATAHTVLEPEYRFDLTGRGWQVPLRVLANRLLIKKLWKVWGPDTWAALDGVVVHSEHQVGHLRSEGAKRVEVIAHFVDSQKPKGSVARTQSGVSHAASSLAKKLMVFGFFTPEKGQDVMIEALRILPSEYHLTFAGGVRRKSDQKYYFKILQRIRELKMISRVALEGYVESVKVDTVFSRADMVVAPFRATTGSGSLALALARGKVIIASDLPLNQELVERIPECLALFESENPESLARVIQEVSSNVELRERMRNAAFSYADRYSSTRMGQKLAEFLK